ncbi:chromosomal replication initiator protein DnaA [Ruminococcaceae bacterium OttesenSCG-928-L11]|nr:chromosomal replication initiator protein DnaA [Ruminococcaceae bacterium OttesenSCG-928-L11]
MESFDQLFDMVKNSCRDQLSDIAFSLWIKVIEPVKFEDSTAFLRVKSEFKKNVIEEKYIPMLKKAFENIMGFEVAISLEADTSGEKTTYPIVEKVESDDGIHDEYEYTFDTFIVGNSNKFAHAASLAVAANPAKAYNPLFIYGPSGLGKTHLLYAICAEVSKNIANQKLIFVKGEEFTNELVEAIQQSSTRNFHDKYRHADILLVDDIQFIGGKESTQEEFFHTFNTLYQDGKQIILTSDRPPKEIKTLEDRLRTRFEWGLLADIQPPDFETRTAIIKRKAEMMNFDVPTEVAEYIANRLKKNIRQLEGTVRKLKAYYQLEGSPPSIMVAQNAIRDILNDNQPVPVTVDRIISEVGRTFSIMPTDIRSNKRSAAISSARQVAMYVVREITQISMSSIGEEFGGRDHSTVVYAIQQVEKNIKKDSHYRETIEDIIKNIRNN